MEVFKYLIVCFDRGMRGNVHLEKLREKADKWGAPYARQLGMGSVFIELWRPAALFWISNGIQDCVLTRSGIFLFILFIVVRGLEVHSMSL